MPSRRTLSTGEVLMVANNEHGWSMTYPLRDGVTRFAMIDALTCTRIPDGPIPLEEAKAMLRRVHGTDYGITRVDAINSFHDALYRADRIRDRRVFLVGESVRVHYPASGVGMNFCIQDGSQPGLEACGGGARAGRGLAAGKLCERAIARDRCPDRRCAPSMRDSVQLRCRARGVETVSGERRSARARSQSKDL